MSTSIEASFHALIVLTVAFRAVPFHVGSYPHDVKKFRAS